MTKGEIIAKTLDDMGLFSGDDKTPHSGEYVEDDGSIIAGVRERLPEGEIGTCADFHALGVKCCTACHGFYPDYDMCIESLPNGRRAWICCAVRKALLSGTAAEADSLWNTELESFIGG